MSIENVMLFFVLCDWISLGFGVLVKQNKQFDGIDLGF